MKTIIEMLAEAHEVAAAGWSFAREIEGGTWFWDGQCGELFVRSQTLEGAISAAHDVKYQMPVPDVVLPAELAVCHIRGVAKTSVVGLINELLNDWADKFIALYAEPEPTAAKVAEAIQGLRNLCAGLPALPAPEWLNPNELPRIPAEGAWFAVYDCQHDDDKQVLFIGPNEMPTPRTFRRWSRDPVQGVPAIPPAEKAKTQRVTSASGHLEYMKEASKNSTPEQVESAAYERAVAIEVDIHAFVKKHGLTVEQCVVLEFPDLTWSVRMREGDEIIPDLWPPEMEAEMSKIIDAPRSGSVRDLIALALTGPDGERLVISSPLGTMKIGSVECNEFEARDDSGDYRQTVRVTVHEGSLSENIGKPGDDPPDDLLRFCLELLAVIHGDGGQHVEAVGVEQACRDAIDKVNGVNGFNTPATDGSAGKAG